MVLQRGLERLPGQSSFILIRKDQYLVTLALVSPRRNRGSRAQTSMENQHFLVQMAQARPGPDHIFEIWEPGNSKKWNQTNIGKYNSQNPNPCRPQCRQGLDSSKRKKTGPISCHFRQSSMDRTNTKHVQHLFIFLGGPMGPIHPVWDHVLVSFSCSFGACGRVL